MFYEYAVDPAILTDYSNVQAFFESFKNRPNRLISDTPRKWVQVAFQAINQLTHDECSPVMRKTLKENLKKLSKNNLCKNRIVESLEPAKSWIDFVTAEHGKYPFSALLGVESVSKPVPVFSFSKLYIKAPSCWEQGGQQHIKREATIMVNAVMPLLKVSKQLILVDRYFSFILPTWARYELFLKELVEKANELNFGKGIVKIEIHTSDHNGDMKQPFEQKVKPWLPEGMTIFCYQWPKKLIHDRFVLTDIGGLSFGHGLDENSDGGLKEVLVSVLEHQAFKKEKAKLSVNPPNPAYVVGIK